MKKIISMAVVTIMLLLVVSPVSYASESVSVTASVNNTSKVVRISGTTSSGSGRVTVLVVNPSGGTDYIDQTTSGIYGSYEFTYTLDENVEGTYSVTVGGDGIAAPKSTTFTYTPDTSSSDEYNIEVSASVNNTTKVVNISGNISSGSGQQVTVFVVNPSGGTDYVDQTTSGANGSYKFTYVLDENIRGVYTVTVGGTGVTSPATTTFTFKPDISDDDDDDDDDEDTGGGGSSSNGPTPTPLPAGTPVGINVKRPALNGQTGEAVTTVTGNAVARAFESATADDKGMKTVSISIPAISGASSYVLKIPAGALASGNSTEMIQIATELGTIVVPSNILSGIGVDGNQIIDVIIARSDASELNEVGDRPVIDIYLRANGAVIPWSNAYAPVSVAIPYTPAEGEDIEKITIWYIDENGNTAPVFTGRYNNVTGMVAFTTTHFSKYAVAYVDIKFEDLAGYGWAQRQIEVLAAKGIIYGTSGTGYIYSPAANITRADYVTLLVKTLSLTAEVKSNFADVEKGKYYYEVVGIARELGITYGKGNNMFDPEAEITRQEMMAMTAWALEIADKLNADGTVSDLSKFVDASEIAPYAVDGVADLVKSGLIVGSNNKLTPTDNTTRAEVAVLMYGIYNK